MLASDKNKNIMADCLHEVAALLNVKLALKYLQQQQREKISRI